jgi:hypothetical protein
MLDTTLKTNARRIAGHSATATAGALRRTADASAWAAASLADSLDNLAASLVPKPSRKVEKYVGSALAFLVIAGLVAFLVRRRRAEPAALEATATDLEAVREQRSAS